MKKNKTKLFFKILLYILVFVVYFISFLLIDVCHWSSSYFHVGLDMETIIFTLINPLAGSNTDTVSDALKFCLPRAVIFVLLSALVVVVLAKMKDNTFLQIEHKNKIKQYSIKTIFRRVVCFGCIIMMLFSALFLNNKYGLFRFIKNQFQTTQIYETYYVDPAAANISFDTKDGEKKNVIYIYLESMETVYANESVQGKNYIKNLTNLANENVSFSNTSGFGGFKNTAGTANTMMSLFSSQTGLNCLIANDMIDWGFNISSYFENVVGLGDILSGFGYNQMFLCGSDANHAGRKTFFENQGYEVFDYYSAIEKGYIDENYRVWWGLEDQKLYNIAKQELSTLAAGGEPFNFTMLTVDTHFTEGYVCDLCQNDNAITTANVVECADRQVAEFIDWCKQQNFYEDTVVVITGDHQRMDNYLVDSVEVSERTIYNCFINSQKTENLNTKNRVFTPMDMFPSVLSAMGFVWDGSRLGLGTNMFSGEQTLAEQLGFDYFNGELSKRSDYYVKKFIRNEV